MSEKDDGGPVEREPYIYRCERHNYVLESRAPPIVSQLKVFCPRCKDEWIAQHIPELKNCNPNAGKVIRGDAMLAARKREGS